MAVMGAWKKKEEKVENSPSGRGTGQRQAIPVPVRVRTLLDTT